VVRAYASIAERPFAWARISVPRCPALQIRRYVLHRFPYYVAYLVVADRIRILTVAHQKRRPSFWYRRLGAMK
jgi:plasmid stabilization system protein ParE